MEYRLQMEYWEMNVEKVNEFNFLMKQLRNLWAGGVKAWLM